MKGSLSIKKISGRTGRTGFHLIEDVETPHAAIQALVTGIYSKKKLLSWNWLLIAEPIARSLYRDLGAVIGIGLKDTYYRARHFSAGSPVPLASDFGPPPPSKQKKGRYSEEKKPALYLSRDFKTAALESGATKDEPIIYVQRFYLDIPQIIVAKFEIDLESKAQHIHYLLLASEYSEEDVQFLHDPHRATQFLAFLCWKWNVEAIEFPSVQGGYVDNPEAMNIVVFGKSIRTAIEMTAGEPEEAFT